MQDQYATPNSSPVSTRKRSRDSEGEPKKSGPKKSEPKKGTVCSQLVDRLGATFLHESSDIKTYFSVQRLLGKGNFGSVIQGKSIVATETTPANTQVAIKVISVPVFFDVSNLVAEIEGLHRAALCKNVSKIYDVYCDTAHETLYIIMEFLKGKDLTHFRVANDEEAFHFWRPLREGLMCLHQSGVAHRDIKAENVIASASFVKWIDLGLSCSDKACSADLVGNLGGLAPEMLFAKNRSLEMWKCADVWSFGCLVFRLITNDDAPLQIQIADLLGKYKTDRANKAKYEDLLRDLLAHPLVLPEKLTQNFPKCAKLIHVCLTADPQVRCAKWVSFLP